MNAYFNKTKNSSSTCKAISIFINIFSTLSRVKVFIAGLLLICSSLAAMAAPFARIDAPPLTEQWFGIYVNSERVGFYRQQVDKLDDGYKIEGNGSVRMKVMNFSKEASMRETYLVSKNMALRAFDVEQTVNGSSSHVTGKVNGNAIYLENKVNGKKSDKLLRFKGDVYPGPALNLYPLIRSPVAGISYKVQAFDPEELKIREVLITVVGEDKTSEGLPAIKLRNNLYPFVNNDIWVDYQGNTLEESVREGLVITKSEKPGALAYFISDWALAKKDLIYDFSMVPVTPLIKNPKMLTGLSVEISDWNNVLPLLQEGGQQSEALGDERIAIRTGSLVTLPPDFTPQKATEAHLKPAVKIESDAPEIMAQARTLAAGIKDQKELVKSLASWTAGWLKDTIDDGGGAAASFKSKSGNCQTHARLYTALARAAGIPTRFVSGLVYLDGKGFLYHSWAESFIEDRWVAVDPTYNEFPANPTHLKLLEGHLPEDMAPIISIIGRIKMTVLKAAY